MVATETFRKDIIRIATAGSVDDGKSTLIGRLLHDSKSLMADELGTAADLARLTDGLRAEREQGITIDVAYRFFATARRSFILADTPGHVRYTRNMVTGASASWNRRRGVTNDRYATSIVMPCSRSARRPSVSSARLT